MDAILKRTGLKPKEIAEKLGCSGEAVRYWKRGGRKPCIAMAIRFERVFGIPRWEIRPDIWDPPASTNHSDKRDADDSNSCRGDVAQHAAGSTAQALPGNSRS
jgi:transcriptional regulator with XRE-family HTH domain